MNKTIMIGIMASDPKAYTTNSGKVNSSFRIAVQRRFANPQGDRETDFFTVVAWGKTAEFCNRYLSKGSRIAVEGSIQNRSYDAQDGSKKWVTEIVADNVESLGGRENGERKPAEASSAAPKAAKQQQFMEVDPGDDLPF